MYRELAACSTFSVWLLRRLFSSYKGGYETLDSEGSFWEKSNEDGSFTFLVRKLSTCVSVHQHRRWPIIPLVYSFFILGKAQ